MDNIEWGYVLTASVTLMAAFWGWIYLRSRFRLDRLSARRTMIAHRALMAERGKQATGASTVGDGA